MKKAIMYLFFLLVLISLIYGIVPDQDRDGVPDLDDNCSNSVGVVDVFGCDCYQKTDASCEGDRCCLDGAECGEYDFRASCMYDLDGDGIFDVYDRCPDTNMGEGVDSSGCSCSQKTCDDENLCTDDYCDDAVDCVFVSNDSNYCGKGKKCENGICVWGEGGEYSEISYWLYDPEEREIRIFYSHSAHTIEVNFNEPLEDNVIILDSTSNIISHELNEERTKLTLFVEGDPSVRGVTTIRATQKPVSVKIDKIEIPERKEKPSPMDYIWLYASVFLIIAALFIVLMWLQRKHEDKLLSSIKRGETKIEREVNLEAELQLKMYIMANLRRGYTAQQIKDELLKDGWRKEIVDRAFHTLRR